MSIGPCLCGDLYCGSCGPAQGNYKCDMCGKWSLDGGCPDPEKCEREAKAQDDQMYRAELIRDAWGLYQTFGGVTAELEHTDATYQRVLAVLNVGLDKAYRFRREVATKMREERDE